MRLRFVSQESALAGIAISGALDVVATAASTGSVSAAVDNAIDKAADRAVKMPGNIRLYNQSMSRIANSGIVAPIVMLDQDAVGAETSDIMQMVFSLFSGYYLQAVNLIAPIENVMLKERLDMLNPNIALNSFHDGQVPGLGGKYGFNSVSSAVKNMIASESITASLRKDDNSILKDDAKLAVGRVFNVSIKSSDGRDDRTVPVMIRLMPTLVPSDIISTLFTSRDSFDMTMGERWWGVKEGRLKFWDDFVLCKDLVHKQRKMALVDMTGLSRELLRRESSIALRAVTGGQGSVAARTNIAIISNATENKIVRELGGGLMDKKVREALFASTGLMIMVVVDREYERVTVYTDGIAHSASYSFKEIRHSEGKGGADVLEVMKSYMMGATASY